MIMSTVKFIVWHCSASEWGSVDAIRSWHQQRGWRTIGYHGVVLNGFLTSEDVRKNRRDEELDGMFNIGRVIDNDTCLEEGEVGAHAYGLNRESIGMCLIGRGEKDFTDNQILSALRWTEYYQKKFGIPAGRVIGHCEIGIFRPQYATNKACPNYDMDTVRRFLKMNIQVA